MTSRSGLGAGLRIVAAPILALLVLVVALVGSAAAERRVALVIGNSAYRSVVALSNPRNDAEDVATALRDLDFEVMIRTDVQKNDIRNVLKDFSRLLSGADTALVYYAGHALQYGGRYFLMPTDAALEDEDALRFDMMPADEIREILAKVSGVRIMVFDACRNDPFSDRPPPGGVTPGSATRGLTRAKRAQGTVVAFATAPFDVAEDGKARNSPFTRAFLARLKEPGLEIGQLFRLVTRDVNEITGGRQTPEITISMLDDYRLNRTESDQMFWSRIRWSEDAADFNDFVSRFPTSPFVADARFRLSALEASRAAIEGARARAGTSGPSEREQAERARICVEEASRVTDLAMTEDRAGLEALRARAACPDTAGRVERVLGDMDRARGEAEARLAAEAAEREKARLAAEAAEREKARLAGEAADRSRGEQCRGEAATIDAAAAAGRTAELQGMIGKVCAENRTRLDAALVDLSRREAASQQQAREEACRREVAAVDAALAGGRKGDLQAIAARNACPDNRGRIDAALAELTRREAAARAEALCEEETRELERLRALGAAGKADLGRLAASARCDRVRPLVTAALDALVARPPVDPTPPVGCGTEAVLDGGVCVAIPAIEEPPLGTKIRVKPDPKAAAHHAPPPDDTEGPAAPVPAAPGPVAAPPTSPVVPPSTPTKPAKPIMLGL